MFEEERIRLINVEPIIYYDQVNNVYGFDVNNRLYNELFINGDIDFKHQFVNDIKNKFNIYLLSPILLQDDIFNDLFGVSSSQILAIQFYIKSNDETQLSNFSQYLRKEWL